MANALTYPSSLPVPMLSSGTGEIDLGLIVSAMDSGMVRTRQKYSHEPGSSTLTTMCSQLEAARLKSFLKESAGASFDCDVLMPGDISEGITTRSVRVVGNLRYEGKSNNLFVLSFPVFVEEAPVSDDDDYPWDYYDALGGQTEWYAQALENAIESLPLV